LDYTESRKRWWDSWPRLSVRIDVEHPIARFVLTFIFFHLHNAVFVLTNRLLLAGHEPYFGTGLMIASLVNSALAVVLFPLLDRLRKPS